MEMDGNGRVLVNEANQTSVRNIFAVGDIIEDKLQLTPVAIQQGKLLAQVKKQPVYNVYCCKCYIRSDFSMRKRFTFIYFIKSNPAK